MFLQAGAQGPGLASPDSVDPAERRAPPFDCRVGSRRRRARVASPSVVGRHAGGNPSRQALGRPRRPERRHRPTPPPRDRPSPHLAYAEFLSRLNDDRSKVDELNRHSQAAVTAGDREGARAAAVAILDFVDGERQWLLDHPPADCYARPTPPASRCSTHTRPPRRSSSTGRARAGCGAGGAREGGGCARTRPTAAFTAFGQELGSTRCPG